MALIPIKSKPSTNGAVQSRNVRKTLRGHMSIYAIKPTDLKVKPFPGDAHKDAMRYMVRLRAGRGHWQRLHYSSKSDITDKSGSVTTHYYVMDSEGYRTGVTFPEGHPDSLGVVADRRRVELEQRIWDIACELSDLTSQGSFTISFNKEGPRLVFGTRNEIAEGLK